jgi:hypothetical protein
MTHVGQIKRQANKNDTGRTDKETGSQEFTQVEQIKRQSHRNDTGRTDKKTGSQECQR